MFFVIITCYYATLLHILRPVSLRMIAGSNPVFSVLMLGLPFLYTAHMHSVSKLLKFYYATSILQQTIVGNELTLILQVKWDFNEVEQRN